MKVERSTTKTAKTEIVKRRGAVPLTVHLPTKPNVPVNDYREYAYLIYGEKKVGKTTLAAQEKGSLVLQFDKQQKALAILEVVIPDWRSFKAYLKELELLPRKGFPYPVVVVDGADEWFRQCQAFVCKDLAVEHPTDAPYGKGWDRLKSEFRECLNRLLRLPCGHIFIAHEKNIEVEKPDGRTISKTVPALTSSAEEILNGKVDGWFFYDYRGSRRVLVVAGDESVGAGHRIEGHFLSADGRPIREVSMGSSSREALEAFRKAFANEQTYTTLKEKGEAAKGKAVKHGKR